MEAEEKTQNKKKNKQRREGWIVPKLEKFSYFIGSGSHFTVHSFMSAFISTYLLMSGINVATSAAVLFILRAWDAINDALFGYFIDRVRFKPRQGKIGGWFLSGRYLPWFRIASFIIPFSLIITFTINTEAPMWLRILQFAIGYLIYDTTFTISSAPYSAMLTSLTSNIDERTFLQSYSVLGQALGLFPVGILGTALIAGNFGYSGAAILFAIYAFLLTIPAMVFIKERVVQTTVPDPGEKYSLKEMLGFFKKSREFLFFEIAQIIWGILQTGGAFALFIAFYIFGDANISIVLGAIELVPTILLLPFFPVIFKRINKITALRIACVLVLISGLAIYFLGPETFDGMRGLFYILSAIRGTSVVFVVVGSAMLLPDFAEVAKYRTNTEHVGIIFSIHSFVQKLVSSLVVSVSFLILGAFGWVSVTADSFEELEALNAQGIGLQTPQALQGLWNVVYLIPALGFGLATVIFLMVNIQRKQVETIIKANLGEISRDEAEEQLKKH